MFYNGHKGGVSRDSSADALLHPSGSPSQAFRPRFSVAKEAVASPGKDATIPPEDIWSPDEMCGSNGDGSIATANGSRSGIPPSGQAILQSLEATETILRIFGILPWWGESHAGMPKVAFVISILAALLTVVWVVLPPLAGYLMKTYLHHHGLEQHNFVGSMDRPSPFGSGRMYDHDTDLMDAEYDEESRSTGAANSAWFAAIQSALLQLTIMLPWYTMVRARSEFALGKRLRARLTKAVVELEDEFEDEDDDAEISLSKNNLDEADSAVNARSTSALGPDDDRQSDGQDFGMYRPPSPRTALMQQLG